MQEFGNIDAGAPGESGGAAPEKLSEQAKERFAEAARQIKQGMKEERRARKRDDRVAKAITQFLGEEELSHMFILISRLVARDCPSIFILAILSLIHKPSEEAVEEYIAENKVMIDPHASSSLILAKASHLTPEISGELMKWATRLQLAMSIDGERVLSKLMIDEGNIDGTVLQLTTFVLVEFFKNHKRPIPYEKLQPLTVNILQSTIEPYLYKVEEYFARQRAEQAKEDDDDDIDEV